MWVSLLLYNQGYFLTRALPHEKILTGNLVWTSESWQITDSGSRKYQNEKALFCGTKCHRTSQSVPYAVCKMTFEICLEVTAVAPCALCGWKGQRDKGSDWRWCPVCRTSSNFHFLSSVPHCHPSQYLQTQFRASPGSHRQTNTYQLGITPPLPHLGL